jgi:hypothetical protein
MGKERSVPVHSTIMATPQRDASLVRWCSVAELPARVQRGLFSPGGRVAGAVVLSG